MRDSGCAHLILRTSWVYAARGGNFARTMLKLAAEREVLNVIDDQIGAPTGADLLADVTAHAVRRTLIQPDLSGTYHCVAGGETHWHGYARFVIEWARARRGDQGRGRRRATGTHQRLPDTGPAAPELAPVHTQDSQRFRSQLAALASGR